MEVHTVRDLGAAVRAARLQRRLTQADLADLAGVSREWLVRLERGHPRLEVQLVLDTLTAVGLTLLTSEATEVQDPTEAIWDQLFTDLSVDPTSTATEGPAGNG